MKNNTQTITINARESATIRAALALWLARMPEQNSAEIEAIAASVDNNPLHGSEVDSLANRFESLAF